MLKSKKQALTMALLCAVASVGFVMGASAEETKNHDLAEVVVEGTQDVLPGGLVSVKGTVGIVGEKDVMDIPFSQTNITEKQLETFGTPNLPLDSALVGNPSIRPSGSILHNDFTIRGFRANGTSMYLNGIHGLMTQFNVPMAAIEGIDVTSGPNTLLGGSGVQYESSTAGGIINARTKKAAAEDFIKYKQTFSGRSSFGEYLDISHRFGKDKEWGVRFNVENLNGETAIKKADMEAKGVYLNIDHKDDNSKSNLFLGWRDVDVDMGMRWFKLGPNVTEMPRPVDGSNNYAFEGMTKGGWGGYAVLNHEQKLNDNLKVFANAGYSKQCLNHNIMGQNSAFVINNNAGDYDLLYQSGGTPQKSYYGQIGATANLETGNLKHEVTLSLDKAWRNRYSGSATGYTGTTGNLGTANIFTNVINQTGMPDGSYTRYLNNKTSIWGASIVDFMEFDKWGAVLGVHKHEGEARTFNKVTGKQATSVKSDATCPTYALSYKPNENVMFYGSHTENFDLGATAGTGYSNAGEVMPPAKTKQNEVGVKYLNKGVMTTLAWFDIKQANNMSVQNPGAALPTYVQDGETQHKGVELSVNGAIAPKWNAMVGIAYMDAKYNKNNSKVLNGVQESGQPKWTGAASLEYNPDDKFSIIGRAVYTGSNPFFNTTKTAHFNAPSYMVYDLGVSYKTKLGSVPTKLSAMCYNVTDKDYWMVARGDQIYASNPRTFFVSAEFDL